MSPIILILGSGANVGQHVARAFAAKSYKVALASRRQKEDSNNADEATFSSDLSDPAAVVNLFAKVEATLGIPSVVVYNAAAATSNDPKDPLSLPLSDFTRDLTVNTTSAFIAAQQAAAGFAQLPASAARTFIYTGNALNTNMTIAPLLTLGVGKSATAHIVNAAAAAYRERGFKFYYADERTTDGTPAFMAISGDAHAEAYLRLAEDPAQGPWDYTFVKGEGYKSFPAASA